MDTRLQEGIIGFLLFVVGKENQTANFICKWGNSLMCKTVVRSALPFFFFFFLFFFFFFFFFLAWHTCHCNFLISFNHFHSMRQNVWQGWRVFCQQCWSFAKDFGAIMYCDYCQENSSQECFQSWKHRLVDQLPSRAAGLRWLKRFMSGARTLEDNDRFGRMATTFTIEKRL